MRSFSFRKIVFISMVMVFVFLISAVDKNMVSAGESCNAEQAVDYIAEMINLGILEDNSFEGKKRGIIRFGINGVENLTSPEEKVTVEKLSAICCSIMMKLGEVLDWDIKDIEEGNYKQDNRYDIGDPPEYPYKEVVENDMIFTATNIKKYNRINDLDEVDEKYRVCTILTLCNGIIIGKSLGKYSQKRNIEPKREVSLSEIKAAIDRTYNSEKRYLISLDGQLIRTKNLPVNASEYKYILDSFPNSFYETRFDYENYPSTYRTEHQDYEKPKFAFAKYMDYSIYHGNIYDRAEVVRRLQDCRFNVDYRTIDKKWVDELVDIYSCRREEAEEIRNIRKEINQYVKFVKKNKVIIEAEPSSTDASAIYCLSEGVMAHTYMKFRIVSCKNFKKNFDKIIYGSQMLDSAWGIAKNYKDFVKIGKWIEGVYAVNYPEILHNELNFEDYPWKWAKLSYIDNSRRNIRKKKILKQFKITKKDKLWYDPKDTYVFYGWK